MLKLAVNMTERDHKNLDCTELTHDWVSLVGVGRKAAEFFDL